MTGDVLPSFNSPQFALNFPQSGAVVLSTPASLALASRHGVLISPTFTPQNPLPRVTGLLQKPTVQAMIASGAVGPSGTALLDTGVFAVLGASWQALLQFSLSSPNPVDHLLHSAQEVPPSFPSLHPHHLLVIPQTPP